jgi:hypothetical protein
MMINSNRFKKPTFQKANSYRSKVPCGNYLGSHGGVVYVVVLSPPATKESGAMGREIESRQGIGWWLLKKISNKINKLGYGYGGSFFRKNK